MPTYSTTKPTCWYQQLWDVWFLSNPYTLILKLVNRLKHWMQALMEHSGSLCLFGELSSFRVGRESKGPSSICGTALINHTRRLMKEKMNSCITKATIKTLIGHSNKRKTHQGKRFFQESSEDTSSWQLSLQLWGTTIISTNTIRRFYKRLLTQEESQPCLKPTEAMSTPPFTQQLSLFSEHFTKSLQGALLSMKTTSISGNTMMHWSPNCSNSTSSISTCPWFWLPSTLRVTGTCTSWCWLKWPSNKFPTMSLNGLCQSGK